MKNVLLLCLSTVNSKAAKSRYSYEIKKNGKTELINIEGYLTNEAPTKAVISGLQKADLPEHLDRVVMICSDKVKEKVVLDDGDKPNLEYLKDSEYNADGKLGEMTHVEIYKMMVESYVKAEYKEYETHPIEYVEVNIPDYTDEQDISAAVIEAANKVTEIKNGDEEIHLYIDFNGGQRYVAFMIASIANLMKTRNVGIRQIMSMNFDNKQNGIVPIQNMVSVFESFDLIAGINEYIKYGRIRGLQSYFGESQNEKILKVLKKMEEFSNNLQLCRTEYIMREKANLYQMLNDYISEESKQEKKDAYEQLFLYVLQDILAGYEKLLNGELPDIVEWCVERDFIQQALTFCSEEMPGYFWNKRIFRASKKEQEEYDYFLKQLDGPRTRARDELQRDYHGMTDSESTKYAYNWMVKYLPYSSGPKMAYYQEMFDGFETEGEMLTFKTPSNNEMIATKEATKHVMGRVKNEKGLDLSMDQIRKARNSAVKYIWHFKQQQGRVLSQKVKADKLTEIFIWYYMLKEQRNSTNHASGGAEDGKEWTYGQLCAGLKKFVSILRTIG